MGGKKLFTVHCPPLAPIIRINGIIMIFKLGNSSILFLMCFLILASSSSRRISADIKFQSFAGHCLLVPGVSGRVVFLRMVYCLAIPITLVAARSVFEPQP